MTIRMLINAMAPNELRIAIVEDGELTELDIEASETSTLKGNVYKGVVHNVEGSLEAAFVDIGLHKQGFLPFSEVSPSQYHRPWNGKGKPKITDVLKRGQEIVVQVAKDAIGDKGATLTTYLSIPGRYTVLMPESEANGISRKIEDDKVRKRIKTIAQRMIKPEGCGFIVRTAGLGQTRLALQKDLDKVVEQWRKLQKAAAIARAPSIIHSEPDLIGRTLRDFFSEEIDEVLIDSKDEYEAAREYFEDVMPVYLDRLQHYQNPIPIFSYYHVEEQIEATFERQVKLASGGSIVFDETEALVAIDVNSGRMTSEGDHEKTVFKTNCEAAEEVARQLKLRDLGGIVVVDFIDMEESKNKREVERVLAEAAKEDKARYKISRINSKGLCVLTRQRIRQGMRKAFQYRCPVCTGTGWLRTAESHSLSLLRRVEARLAQGGVGEVRVLTHKETADYVQNQKRSELLALERNFGCRLIVVARPEMDRGKDEVTYLSNKEVLDEITDKLPPREERRTRGGKRKRRKKRGSDAPAEVAEVEVETQAEARSKRRKKRRRGRGTGDGESARGAETLERAAGDADASASDRSADERNGEDADVTPLAPKGSTTFTGRLSPEEIERAKAERRARKARRDGDHATADRILAALGAPIERGPAESAHDEHPDPDGPMDVMHALAVAEAVLGANGGDIDEDLVLEAAGVAPSPQGELQEHGDEAVADRAVALEGSVASEASGVALEADGVAPEANGVASEASFADPSDDDPDGGDEEAEARGDDEPAEEGDGERKGRRRRRRRRSRKKRPATEQQAAEPEGQEEEAGEAAAAAAAPEAQPALAAAGSVPASPRVPPDPELSAKRKALLVRIFGAR